MATTAEIRTWLRAQGEQVGDKGALPERLLAKYAEAHGGPGPRRLPTPAEVDDLSPEDFGPTIDIGPSQEEPPAGPGPIPVLPGPGPDEPPKHAGRDWQQKRSKGQKSAAPRVTVGMRQDITAKIEFPLAVFGSIWQARDPLCGGVFIDQTPATAAALTSIVCESADLIKFFTGPGGAFMRWLEVGAALMPVAQVVMAHHVYHSIEIAPEGEQSEQASYAA